jgi:hypothetical protein
MCEQHDAMHADLFFRTRFSRISTPLLKIIVLHFIEMNICIT